MSKPTHAGRSSDNYFDIRQDEHPEKSTTECWCGGEKLKWSPVCCFCYNLLPLKVQIGLHKQYERGYEEAYSAATNYLFLLSADDLFRDRN